MDSDTIKNLENSIHAGSITEAVIDAIPAPVFYKGADGRYLGCNEAFEEFVGLPREMLIGKTVFELWDKDLAEIYHAADQALMDDGGKQLYEAQVTYGDGTLHDVMFHKATFFTDDDSVSGMVGVILDITERKGLEKALQKSESLFAHAFKSNPAIIALTDPISGKHLDVNESWLQALKFDRQDVIGKSGFDMGIWANLDARTRLLEILNQQGYVRNYYVELKASDGEIVCCEISLETIKAETQDLVLWTAHDITQRKKAEKASEAKTVFLSNMSHEFRTPLNAMLGFAQLLGMNADQNLSPKQLEWIDQISSSGNILLDIVNDVLDLARIESGRATYHPETFLPRETFKECFDIIRPLAAKKNLTLQGHPQTERAVYVDKAKLRQVLLNLLGNAVKYNRDHGHINFGCRNTDDSHLELYVQDTGLGIKQEDLCKIFEPFYRLPEYSNLVEGTGVGLSIVKKNIEMMQGTIEATSTYGVGSCFTITLPSVAPPDVT